MQTTFSQKTLFNHTRQLAVLTMLLGFCLSAWGQDTLRRQTLKEVNVTGEQLPPPPTAATPTQTLTQERLESQGARQLSDALQQMAGLTVKDYGGVGGIKTLSVRGLGSQFSSLTIDGVSADNCQNGQIDLGKYLLGNTSFVSMSNGQPDSPLQSAKSYASSSLVQMVSAIPQFAIGRRTHLKLGLEGGSFGYLNPSLLWEQRLGRRASLSVWANHLKSDGDYPFTIHYGNAEDDSTSRERRNNSAVALSTLESNFNIAFDSSSVLKMKGHLSHSYNELPGPVTFYSTIKGSEHSENIDAFLQGQYRKRFSDRCSMQLSGKLQYGQDIYEDTAARNASHLIHNEYAQKEGYLSGGFDWNIAEWLDLYLCSDETLNLLNSNLSKNDAVTRWSNQSVAVLTARKNNFNLSAHLLYTHVSETATTTADGATQQHQYQRLSPYFGLTCPLVGKLKMRYFFKEGYRMPSLNEMYYFTMTRDLSPEKALQHNFGLMWSDGNYDEEHEIYGRVTLDGYYNQVRDKLIAIPTQNMFLWSMMNLGKVDILGADLTGHLVLRPMGSKIRYTLTANYSYQHATDRSDPAGKTYGHQIPYTPRHSGGATFLVESSWVDICYTLQAVGKRYCMQQNSEANALKGYADQSIALSKKFSTKHCSWMVHLQVNNIFDVQYEVVKSYPMMGINWRIGATIKI